MTARSGTIAARVWLSLLGVCALVASLTSHARAEPPLQLIEEYWYKIDSDHKNYYSSDSLAYLAAGFGIGAVLAHTPADQEVRDWYQIDVRSADTNEFSRTCKKFGEGPLLITAVLSSFAIGQLTEDFSPTGSTIGDWGERGARALIVGTPPLLLTQWATGASRPNETGAGSDWKPFNDDNGVSGHAFIGGIPFITAAQMTDRPLAKAGLYFCSTWSAWSRINDDHHYLSQSALGWVMAYAACSAVNRTEGPRSRWQVIPLPSVDGAGVGLVYEH